MKYHFIFGLVLVVIYCFNNVQSIDLYKNCHRNAIRTAVAGYAAGDSAPYDFTAAYPYFTDNITLTVVDSFRIVGINAVKETLNNYPPWITREYETVGEPHSLEFIIDEKKCVGIFRMNRTLRSYYYQPPREQIEILVLKFNFFKTNDNLKVRMYAIEESLNSYALANHLFIHYFQNGEDFCKDWQTACGDIVPNDFGPKGCISYVNGLSPTTAFQNRFTGTGDTLQCRNVALTKAVTIGTFPATLAERIVFCRQAGPADGTPGRQCFN